MRPHGAVCLAAAVAALAASGWSARAGESSDRDLSAVLAQVGQRVAAYYQRAQQIICLERSKMVPIGSDWTVQGFGRTVESELRVELEAAGAGALPAARVVREIRRINGRAPRDRDRTDRSACTDPTPLSPEPLAFLLPGERIEYRFTSVRDTKERNRAALLIEFASANRKGRPELIEDELGHDDCFDWKGPVAIAGRVWVDAATYDVLRLERHIAGPTDVHVPLPLQRKYRFAPWLTLDRDDLTLRYTPIAFNDPDETLLLPESIESMTVFRGGLQSMRRVQTFSEYRRFLTGSRIIK